MSINTIECLLFDVAASPELAGKLKGDPDGFMKSYALAPEEADLIRSLDMHEITRRGVNPMLAMRAFAAIEGRDQMPEYFRKMRKD
jgi:hypothetical protein|tara:strand:- start:439 stop:696 length:258 start_codon:yes stop_codon:yes gene_type:complete